VDLAALADDVAQAVELLHAHKTVTAGVARRCGALLVDFDEYTGDERLYDRLQDFLGVRSRVPLRHANMQSPPVDAEVYRRLREELDRRGVPMRFNPEAV
jgi:hypothetical protein